MVAVLKGKAHFSLEGLNQLALGDVIKSSNVVDSFCEISSTTPEWELTTGKEKMLVCFV